METFSYSDQGKGIKESKKKASRKKWGKVKAESKGSTTILNF
jgi:hypothetical protein